MNWIYYIPIAIACTIAGLILWFAFFTRGKPEAKDRDNQSLSVPTKNTNNN